MSGHLKSSQGEEKGRAGEEAAGGRQAGRLSEPQLLPALPAQEACGSQAASRGSDTQAGARPPALRGQAPGARRPGSSPAERPPPQCSCRRSEVGRKAGRKKFVVGRGVGWAALLSGCPLGGGPAGSPGAPLARLPSGRVVYIPGVSFKPGAEAGSRPSGGSGAVSRENSLAVIEAGRRLPLARAPAAPGGEPALRTAPSPRPAGFLTDVPGEGATRTRCPRPRRRGRAPPLFSPSLGRQECESSFQSPVPHPSSSPVPAPARAPTSAPAGSLPTPLPPPPETEEERTRGNYCSPQAARTHAHLSPWAPPPGRGSPIQALA